MNIRCFFKSQEYSEQGIGVKKEAQGTKYIQNVADRCRTHVSPIVN